MNTYQTFWKFLEFALTVAEISHPKANKHLAAIQRLKNIEDGVKTDGTPSGQTGYLANVEPFGALADYVAHIYDGARAPYWLITAERGY